MKWTLKLKILASSRKSRLNKRTTAREGYHLKPSFKFLNSKSKSSTLTVPNSYPKNQRNKSIWAIIIQRNKPKLQKLESKPDNKKQWTNSSIDLVVKMTHRINKKFTHPRVDHQVLHLSMKVKLQDFKKSCIHSVTTNLLSWWNKLNRRYSRGCSSNKNILLIEFHQGMLIIRIKMSRTLSSRKEQAIITLISKSLIISTWTQKCPNLLCLLKLIAPLMQHCIDKPRSNTWHSLFRWCKQRTEMMANISRHKWCTTKSRVDFKTY